MESEMDSIIIDKLKAKKRDFLKDGFEIVGVFGSYARGEERQDSDIDILYNIKPIFLQKYGGFEAFAKLSEIKQELKRYLNKDVDIASIDNPSKTFKEYALKDVVYV
jgi:predicted nucleotidyltransferase